MLKIVKKCKSEDWVKTWVQPEDDIYTLAKNKPSKIWTLKIWVKEILWKERKEEILFYFSFESVLQAYFETPSVLEQDFFSLVCNAAPQVRVGHLLLFDLRSL